jgi:hypothetical protein
MRKINNKWIAGFWESEGCVSALTKTRYCIDIAQSITKNRDVEEMMDKIKDIYGGEIRKNIISNYKPQLRWRINKREEVINFIKNILPYCQFRKQELTNALNIMEEAGDLRKKYFDEKKAIEMREKGKSWEYIAKSLDVDWRTVKKRICSVTKPCEVVYSNRTIIDIDKAKKLREKGLTYSAIGKILGIHISVAHKYLTNKYKTQC